MKIGEGVSGVKSRSFVPSFFLKVISFAMMVSIGLGYCFGGKGFSSFGILDYKYSLQNV